MEKTKETIAKETARKTDITETITKEFRRRNKSKPTKRKNATYETITVKAPFYPELLQTLTKICE